MGKSFNDKTYQTYKSDKVTNKKKVKHSKMEPYKRTKVWISAPKKWIDNQTVLNIFMSLFAR